MKIRKNHENCTKIPRTRRGARAIHDSPLQRSRAQRFCACFPRRSAVCTQTPRLPVQRGFCVHTFSAYGGKTPLLRAQGENAAFACTVFRRITDFAWKRSFCVHRYLANGMHRSTRSGVHAPCVPSLACTLEGVHSAGVQKERKTRTRPSLAASSS